MYPKFLSLFTIAISCTATAAEVIALPKAWNDLHYGSCYSSLKAGMSDTYGANFPEDENIVQSPRRLGFRNFVIASDTTSGTNAQRSVFEQRGGQNWCVVLASPPVADLIAGPVLISLQRPITWSSVTQAPPGFPETKVIYKWDDKIRVYKPADCYTGRAGRWRSFDCNQAYR